MTSTYKNKVDVLSAQRKFGEAFTFAPEVITRTLDIVSQSHQTLIVDLPRHVENWSDAVILGSTDVYRHHRLLGSRPQGSAPHGE